MDVIDELIACCEAWEPEVCVMGNVRAGEAAKALRGLRADLTMAGAFHKAAVAQRNSAWEEIEHLRAELAERKATTPAPKSDCRTCAHVYTDMESYGCKRSITTIVCIKGDGYVPSLPVRLYETER